MQLCTLRKVAGHGHTRCKAQSYDLQGVKAGVKIPDEMGPSCLTHG
jgi:hypothetical protein